MQLLQDGVIALLAAIGLTALLWSLAGWIFRPRGRKIHPARLHSSAVSPMAASSAITPSCSSCMPPPPR